MVKRTAWIGIIFCLLLLTAWGAFATVPRVTYQELEIEGLREIMVDSPLANYIFSERNGALKSIFLTFAPYGSKVAELVYGAFPDPDSRLRSYSPDGEFPFSLIRYIEQDGETIAELDAEYTLTDLYYEDNDDRKPLHIQFTGEFLGYQVRKSYTIDPTALYTIDVSIEITLTSGDPQELHLLFAKIIPSRVIRDPVYIFNGEPSSAIFQAGSYYSFGGMGIMDGEIVLFLSSESGQDISPVAKPLVYPEPTDNKQPRCEGNCGRYSINLGRVSEPTTFNFTLYGGRLRYIPLEAAGIEALDQAGFFSRAMVYVIRLLNWLYFKTGNYGWSIILFTIIMRIVLFPLMRKQYHSMARIQQIQPRLKRIQAKYKDNKEEMQKRTLEVYRKEKVNPMSGCLPMAVQLPIIIVIWRALLYASEQIHLSPGFLWVPDLSLHDPYFILVVVTTLIMMAQQYFMSPMTSDAAGPQKYMGYFFPLMMAFMLWRFPAGLWLYYLLTTAAQVGQQAFVNWEMARASAGQVALPDDDFIDVDEPTTESDDGDTA